MNDLFDLRMGAQAQHDESTRGQDEAIPSFAPTSWCNGEFCEGRQGQEALEPFLPARLATRCCLNAPGKEAVPIPPPFVLRTRIILPVQVPLDTGD